MTQLAANVNADAERWTLDSLPSTQYVQVDDETIEVRAMFPSSTYSLTGETLPPRIRVRRGIAGTTKASHLSGATLTPNYGLGSGGEGGAIAVTGTESGEVAAATGLVLPGIVTEDAGVAIYQPGVYVQTTDPGAVGAGAIWKDITTEPPYSTWWERNADNAGWDAFFTPRVETTAAVDASAYLTAVVVDGIADAGPNAEASGDGSATVSGQATTSGVGNASASSIANAMGGGGAYVENFATAVGGGDAEAPVEASTDTGAALTGVKAIRGVVQTGFVVEVSGAGVASIIALGLPTANPNAAGQLWNDAGTLKVSAG